MELIRNWLTENCGNEIANEIRILYGGPVTETNTENIIKLPGVDGFLIGSTSTKPVFRNIFDMVNNQAIKDASYVEPERK